MKYIGVLWSAATAVVLFHGALIYFNEKSLWLCSVGIVAGVFQTAIAAGLWLRNQGTR